MARRRTGDFDGDVNLRTSQERAMGRAVDPTLPNEKRLEQLSEIILKHAKGIVADAELIPNEARVRHINTSALGEILGGVARVVVDSLGGDG